MVQMPETVHLTTSQYWFNRIHYPPNSPKILHQHVLQTHTQLHPPPAELPPHNPPPWLRRLPIPDKHLRRLMPEGPPMRLPPHRLRPVLPQRIPGRRGRRSVQSPPRAGLSDHQDTERLGRRGRDVRAHCG